MHMHGQAFTEVRRRGTVREPGVHELVSELASPFRLAAIFLLLDPREIHTPLAINRRACTPWLPAHLDPDVNGLMPHYVLAGTGKQEGLVSRGCSLFVGSGPTGGQIVEVDTDCAEGELLVVGFSPDEQLHWVEDRGCADLSVDKTGVRAIPFNNKWLSAKLQQASPLQLAQLHPRKREDIVCGRCGKMAKCPSQDPGSWIEHFGRSVQVAAGMDFTCFACCSTHMPGRLS
jgi:hypothetical protein